MSTNPHYTNAKQLKQWPKKFINNFTKDDSYLHKEKICSQRMIPKTLQKNSLFIENNVIKSD
jgi:hypothetical protein